VQVFEYRTTRHRIAEAPAVVRSPRDTLPVIRAMLDDRESEALVVLVLSTKNAVIAAEVVYTGNVSASLVRVGEVFRLAVRMNGSAVIIAHNHPSGDPTPSPDDLHLTAECIAAGRLLDIAVLDHIVTGEGDAYRSLRESGVTFDRVAR
jgi:DNA repair protein RadC